MLTSALMNNVTSEPFRAGASQPLSPRPLGRMRGHPHCGSQGARIPPLPLPTSFDVGENPRNLLTPTRSHDGVIRRERETNHVWNPDHYLMKLSLSHVATAGLLASALQFVTLQAQSTLHLDHARTLVAQLRTQGEAGEFFDENGVEYNRYGASWSNSYIAWGDPSYVHAVCSNFYIRLMMDSYPGWTARGVGFTSSSPSSAVLHDAVEANACQYVHVTDFGAAQPGDLLAIKYLDGSASSGHTMILDSAEPSFVYGDGTVRWSVQVIDCSSGVHSQDTRVFPGYTSSGVGSGYMNVYTLNGQITGYSWSQSNSSKIYTPNLRHLTVGRLAF